MQYMLIFKAYHGDKMASEEWHYFNNLSDLYNYAAARLTFVGSEKLCDRYDIQAKRTETDNTPPAA